MNLNSDLTNSRLIFCIISILILSIQSVVSIDCKKKCENNGKCVIKNGEEICECLYGYGGEYCTYNYGECVENRCKNNGTCTNVNGKYKCSCIIGYTGTQCEKLDPCLANPNPCKNGECVTTNTGRHYCKCDKGFSGTQCEIRLTNLFCPDSYEMRRSYCNHRGECINWNKTLICKCDRGYHGSICQLDTDPGLMAAQDKCSKMTKYNYWTVVRGECDCLNGGECIGRFASCLCKQGFTGNKCEKVIHSPKVTTTTISPAKYQSIKNSIVQSKCPVQCELKFSNGICDNECNKQDCNFDGGDCNPWKRCYTETSFNCQNVFRDGICNPQCNNVECFFDGSDCEVSKCVSDKFCTTNYQNKICNPQCNNPQCGFDGGDCANTKENNETKNDNDNFFPTSNFETCNGSTNKTIIDPNNHEDNSHEKTTKQYFLDIILSTDAETFRRHHREFLRKLGVILKAVLKIEYIKESHDKQSNLTVRVELDPMECINHGGQCFASLTQMINYLQASINSDNLKSLPFKMKSVKSFMKTEKHRGKPSSKSMSKPGVIFLSILSLIIFSVSSICIVLTRQRWLKNRSNTQTSGTWTPKDVYSTSSLSMGGPQWPKNLNSTTNNQFEQHPQSIYPSTELLDHNTIQFQGYKQHENTQYAPLLMQKISADSRKRKRGETTPNTDPVLTASFEAISTKLKSTDGINPFSGSSQTQLLQLINNCASKTMQANSPDVTKPKYRNLAATQPTIHNDDNNLGCYVNEHGESLLHIAARMNAGPAILKRLHNLWPNMLESLDEWGRTPYITAVASAALETIECLNGLVKQRRKEKKHAQKMKQEVLNSLNNKNDDTMKKNVDETTQEQQQPIKSTTVLIEAVKNSSDDIVGLLLDEGCSSVTGLDKDGRSVVHWAAMMDNVGVLARLSKVKAFQKLLELRDNEDKSALCLAAQEKSIDAAIYLADATVRLWRSKNNAPPQNIIKHEGDNTESPAPCPIDIALEHGYLDLAETLKAKLSVMNLYSSNKSSPSKSTSLPNRSNSSISKQLSTIQESNIKEYGIDNTHMTNQENLEDELDLFMGSPLDLPHLDHMLDTSNVSEHDRNFSEKKDSDDNVSPNYNVLNSQMENHNKEPVFPPMIMQPSLINQYSENQSMKINTPTKSTNSSSELSPNFPPIIPPHKSKSSSRNGRESNKSASSISPSTFEQNISEFTFPHNYNKMPINNHQTTNGKTMIPQHNNDNNSQYNHNISQYYTNPEFTQLYYNQQPIPQFYNNNAMNIYNNPLPQPNTTPLQQQVSPTQIYKQQYNMIYPNNTVHNPAPYSINQSHNLYNI